MATQPRKKPYTVAEANATLPLVRAIVQDVIALAGDLVERQERLERQAQGSLGEAHQEEWEQVKEELGRDQERLQEFERELHNLGIQLKDYRLGLIDFPCLKDGREVYLCWKLGEPEVSYWHEVDAGFAGRKKLTADAAR